jgi:hypothetical protein
MRTEKSAAREVSNAKHERDGWSEEKDVSDQAV